MNPAANRFVLYVKTGCPYVARVLSFASERGIKFEERNIANMRVAEELIARGGKRQVPYLVDMEKSIEMYESEDIVEYLRNNLSSNHHANQS